MMLNVLNFYQNHQGYIWLKITSFLAQRSQIVGMINIIKGKYLTIEFILVVSQRTRTAKVGRTVRIV